MTLLVFRFSPVARVMDRIDTHVHTLTGTCGERDGLMALISLRACCGVVIFLALPSQAAAPVARCRTHAVFAHARDSFRTATTSSVVFVVSAR